MLTVPLRSLVIRHGQRLKNLPRHPRHHTSSHHPWKCCHRCQAPAIMKGFQNVVKLFDSFLSIPEEMILLPLDAAQQHGTTVMQSQTLKGFFCSGSASFAWQVCCVCAHSESTKRQSSRLHTKFHHLWASLIFMVFRSSYVVFFRIFHLILCTWEHHFIRRLKHFEALPQPRRAVWCGPWRRGQR